MVVVVVVVVDDVDDDDDDDDVDDDDDDNLVKLVHYQHNNLINVDLYFSLFKPHLRMRMKILEW